LAEEGLDPVLHAHSFYTASSVPVCAEKLVERSAAAAAS
jgi:hypothetical protein